MAEPRPRTYLSTIVTGSTVSTTRTLGTGGALDTAFTGETSLTLERGSRRGAEAVRGGGGHRGGCRKPAEERVGFNLPWHRRDRGHRRLRGHPVREGEGAESEREGVTLGTGMTPAGGEGGGPTVPGGGG